MKPFVLTIVLAGLLAGAAPQSFTGVITDTLCGAKHNMKGHSDAACAKMCTKASAQYALFDGQNVLKLSDQKTAAKFAAQEVKVTGTLDPVIPRPAQIHGKPSESLQSLRLRRQS